MKSYNVEVIDISSVLPLFTITDNSGFLTVSTEPEIPTAEIVFEKKKIEIKEIQNEQPNNEPEDSKGRDYIPDEKLGRLGEEEVERRLVAQEGLEVERVSETRTKSPGYDIEVRKSNIIYGFEVKAKRNKHNTIHLTNNEIRAMLRLKDKSFLVIVGYDQSDKVADLYRVRDFVSTFKIDPAELESIILTETLNDSYFYPQVFVINLPIDILESCKISLTEDLF